jgi:hypothetical protein
MLGVDVLDSELSSLDGRSQLTLARSLAQAQPCPYQERTHRQNSQQRRLASILQPDHGDVHLGRPVGVRPVSLQLGLSWYTVLLFSKDDIEGAELSDGASGIPALRWEI